MSLIRIRKPTGTAAAQNGQENEKNGSFTTADEGETSKNVNIDVNINRNLLSKKHWIFLVLFSFFVYYWAVEIDGWLPKPLTDSEAGLEQFSEIRAMKNLKVLSDYGPKPSGSYSAEVLTRNFIVKEAEKIKSERNAKFHGVEIGVQKPSGCFDFSFLSGFMLCYKNVTNIVVILTPTTMANTSILVNCHFDSVPASPGATDDLASCVIMLEILSILSKSDSSLTHNVIFLFNGAEENFMQGAHGFITQHRLRHTIKAFINLEGAGAGGREFLFQSGPSNMWLLHAYLDSARHPHGSVMAQEVFESGVIMSDTDYRVFRDYGRLSGLDIAYVKNGYLYHTEFDKAEMIPVGSLQRAGENVLAILKNLAHSPCLSRPCPKQDEKIIFFDVLGFFIVQYNQNFALFANFSTVFFIVFKIYMQFRYASETKNLSKKEHLSKFYGYTPGDFVAQLIIHVICLICLVSSTYLLTKLVAFADLTLSWYSQPALLLPLYLAPLILIGFSVHLSLPKLISRLKINDPFRREQVTFDVSMSFMALILLALTLLGIRSAYFVFVLTLFPLFRDPLRLLIGRSGVNQKNANLLFLCHWITALPGSILGSYALVEMLTFFIPMMGRSCAKLNPEYFVAGVCALAAIVVVLFTVSLVHVSRGVAYLMKCGVALILLFAAVAALTPFGAPYKFDPAGPRWRRLHVQHVRRQLTMEDGRKLDENGVWMVSLDYRGVQDLPAHTFLQGSKEPYCLEDDEFCGLPYYLPLRGVIPASSTLWLSVPNAPSFSKPLTVNMLSKEKIASNKLNFTFSVDGPDHITLSISPSKSWHLESWTFTPQYLDSQTTYFVYLAHVDSREPWTFSLVFRAEDEKLMKDDNRKFLLAAATHEVHGEHQYSDTLKTIVRTVRERRVEPELTKGHWKWVMTVDGWCSDYSAQYFG